MLCQKRIVGLHSFMKHAFDVHVIVVEREEGNVVSDNAEAVSRVLSALMEKTRVCRCGVCEWAQVMADLFEVAFSDAS